MTELMPRFREFCARNILAQNYDYIVPIESKGMLILHDALTSDLSTGLKLRFRRSFDFIPPEELEGKRVALVDDTVVYGRVLNNSVAPLQRNGVKEVGRYAFMLYDRDEDSRRWRQIDDIHLCSVLDFRDYAAILDELSQITMRDRPSYPDHMTLRSRLMTRRPTDDVVNVLRRHGAVLAEYNRSREYRLLSLHYPDFSPALPAGALVDGVDKIRVGVAYDGRSFVFSPEIFPSLPDDCDSAADPLVAAFEDALSREWQDPKTQRLNRFESFTLAMRLKQAAALRDVLTGEGCELGLPVLDVTKLTRYYGMSVTNTIAGITAAYLANPQPISTRQDSLQQIDERVPEAFPLSETLLTLLE
ncbi:MAG: hypothetical protein AAB393_11425, partial [Bacteroidota bacterium]